MELAPNITPRDEQRLVVYFHELAGEAPTNITPLRAHASERRRYRLQSQSTSLVCVINSLRKENDAFVAFAQHFHNQGLPVPRIHLYRPLDNLYIEDDLGDVTLLDLLLNERKSSGENFPASVASFYKQALEQLPRLQIRGATGFNFSLCVPERMFVPGNFARDCALFATEFVRRILPQFDITKLTSDFVTLLEYLERAESPYFMHRDFQARNIMCLNGQTFFIDFQGGSRGPMLYDVVSLLFQSSARIPSNARRQLLEQYVQAASQFIPLSFDECNRYVSGFAVARMLQVLGVYGEQGLGAGKEYFVRNIPTAIATLDCELTYGSLEVPLPTLRECVETLTQTLSFKSFFCSELSRRYPWRKAPVKAHFWSGRPRV